MMNNGVSVLTLPPVLPNPGVRAGGEGVGALGAVLCLGAGCKPWQGVWGPQCHRCCSAASSLQRWLSHSSAAQGAPGMAACAAKSVEDPRNPWEWGHSLQRLQRGKARGGGVGAVISSVAPAEPLKPGEVGVGCHGWKGTAALPREPLSVTWGARASTQPHGNLWYPSATRRSHGPPPTIPFAWPTALVLSHHPSSSPCPSSPCLEPFSGSPALSPPHKE